MFSEYISERSAAGSNITATEFEKAAIPFTPVSPHPLRNGLLTLVVGLALCAMLTLALPLSRKGRRQLFAWRAYSTSSPRCRPSRDIRRTARRLKRSRAHQGGAA